MEDWTRSAEKGYERGNIEGEGLMGYSIPAINYDLIAMDGHDVFREKFARLSDGEWSEVLQRSVDSPSIDGVKFPTFPEPEFQQRIHGHSGVHSMVEAGQFYQFIKSNTYITADHVGSMKALDFGSGWGRMLRPFMRDFSLPNLFGFEPNLLYCAIARSLNPYVTFFSGKDMPDGSLPSNFFDLMFGWSIFSHLSRVSASAWLGEAARILQPGGYCVLTTWGERFLERLVSEAEDAKNGKEIHWYSALCIDKAGDIGKRLEDYRSGQFVWWDSVGSDLYGEAFISPTGLDRIIADHKLPFEIVKFDQTSLPQDAFVLRRLKTEAPTKIGRLPRIFNKGR